MTLIVAASAHGAPGATSALLLLAALWPDAQVPVYVEADVSGGVVAARYELATTPGLATLAESLRHGETIDLLDHAQRLPSGVACIPAAPGAAATRAQLVQAGPELGATLANAPHPVLLDVGRLLPGSPAEGLIASADLMLWFVLPTREDLLALKHRMAECANPADARVVLVGNRPYSADEVAEALDIDVLHTLPIDQRGAELLNLGGNNRTLRRTPLARSAGTLAEIVTQQAWMTVVGDGDGDVASRFDAPSSSTATTGGDDALPDSTAAATTTTTTEPEIAVWTPNTVAEATPSSPAPEAMADPVVEPPPPPPPPAPEATAPEPEDEPEIAVWTPPDTGGPDGAESGAGEAPASAGDESETNQPEIRVWTPG